jgi:hypothetical protein
MMIFAGIGARETPGKVLHRMKRLSTCFGLQGYTLRSGGAAGADTAFEDAYLYHPDWPREIFREVDATSESLEMAAMFLPNFENIPDGIKGLFARNCQIIMGRDLKSPVSMVIAWTPGGEDVGGAGHAIRVAKHHNIPVINLGSPKPLEISPKLSFYGV